jgi:hypothetical protein
MLGVSQVTLFRFRSVPNKYSIAVVLIFITNFVFDFELELGRSAEHINIVLIFFVSTVPFLNFKLNIYVRKFSCSFVLLKLFEI